MSDDDQLRDVPDDGLFHGPELDRALKAASETPPDQMGVCPTALDSRKGAFLEQQLDEAADPGFAKEIEKELLDAGAPFDKETIAIVQLRSTLGGSFTMGMGTGIGLLGAALDDEQRAAVEWALRTAEDLLDGHKGIDPPPSIDHGRFTAAAKQVRTVLDFGGGS